MRVATAMAKLPVEEVIDNTMQLHLGIERSLSPSTTRSSNASPSTEITTTSWMLKIAVRPIATWLSEQ
jgi:hypothetical protein